MLFYYFLSWEFNFESWSSYINTRCSLQSEATFLLLNLPDDGEGKNIAIVLLQALPKDHEDKIYALHKC